jgi:hypothetical protein
MFNIPYGAAILWKEPQKSLPILFFKKKKEQHKFFFKLCLSLKGQATLWTGLRASKTSSQFFFSKKRFCFFFMVVFRL